MLVRSDCAVEYSAHEQSVYMVISLALECRSAISKYQARRDGCRGYAFYMNVRAVDYDCAGVQCRVYVKQCAVRNPERRGPDCGGQVCAVIGEVPVFLILNFYIKV